MNKELDAALAVRQEVAKAVEQAKSQIKFGKWDQPGIPNFPTLSKCSICEGYTAAYPNVKDPLVATMIAMIQHGYYIKAWEEMNCMNREIFPHPCVCECKQGYSMKRHCERLSWISTETLKTGKLEGGKI